MSALDKFAEELKEKRETFGISISDVYEITRIDKNYLIEMEKGNFEIMPDVYMRAFIRKYADAIELDPTEIIKQYEAAQSGKTVDEKTNPDSKIEAKEKISEFEDESESKTEVISDTNYNPYIIIGFIIAVALIGYFYYTFIYSDNNKIIVEQRVEDIIPKRNSETKTPRFESKNSNSEVEVNNNSEMSVGIIETDSLSLKINALDTVWFRTQIDKTKKDEFILYPNKSKTLSAKSQIDILVGNTGGIEFILNGKKLEFKGKKGEIRNVRINSNGIQFSKIETQLKK